MIHKKLSWKLGLLSLIVGIIGSMVTISCTQTTPTTTPTIVTLSGPQSGGVLKIAITRDAILLGCPWAWASPNDSMIATTCLETLVTLDKSGKLVPVLATSWEIATDLKTSTFKLRQGVKFHDGTDFNALAAKWNLDMFRTSKRPDRLPGVSSIDVIDDYTIRLNFSKYDSTLFSCLSAYCAMASPDAYKSKGEDWCKANPVGTGPFKFVSWVRDSKHVFKRFDGYWKAGLPYLDGVEWHIIADPAVALASLLRADVDVCKDLPPKEVADLANKGEFNITMVTVGYNSIIGDSARENSPFAILGVRQAIGYAIDIQEIVKSQYFGYAEATSQIRGRNSLYYNPNIVGTPYNPTKAKQLLTEAGYATGFKTDFVINNDPVHVSAMTAVQGYLRKVGIDAQINMYDQAKWATFLYGGWTGLFQLNGIPGIPDFDWEMKAIWSPGGRLIPSALKLDDIGKLADQSVATGNFDTKIALCREMATLLDKNCLLNNVAVTSALAVSKKSIQDTGLCTIPIQIWTPSGAWIQKR